MHTEASIMILLSFSLSSSSSLYYHLVQTVVNRILYFAQALVFQSFQDIIVIEVSTAVNEDLIINRSLAIVFANAETLLLVLLLADAGQHTSNAAVFLSIFLSNLASSILSHPAAHASIDINIVIVIVMIIMVVALRLVLLQHLRHTSLSARVKRFCGIGIAVLPPEVCMNVVMNLI